MFKWRIALFFNETWYFFSPNRLFRLTANITGLYWELYSAVLQGVEYRYFAYGMYSKMDTPPTYSYVCTKATFVKYDKTQHGGKGAYDFDDRFYITNLQVIKTIFFVSEFVHWSFSFNHSLLMVHFLVDQITAHHSLQVAYGWAFLQVYFY